LKFFESNGYTYSRFVDENGKPSAMDYSDLNKTISLLKTFQSINFLFEKQG
jgi:hypothetical protein